MNPLCGDCEREGVWDGNVCVCPKCGLELATRPAATGNKEPTVETLQLLLKQSQKENALLYEELTQLKAWVKELMNHLSSSGT